ncbi:hypothetical protein CCUG63695_02783 [Mycobacteroides franklinii]|uniref:Transmembrane protein n=2 Tax=Mycobacteriaceae TaxID=1762 RepID=A0A4R8R9K9_9MYCO|nr:hypothetical protein [Mycobacteroides franklinii]TDZ42807.1 hypothetical protein CCUG64054_02856 [Mycobacteroides franklinii]TDZ52955.1 hypothetical protein CCUG63697_01441 [Mycobacteroides franklinii]TDZ56362.1 hypothetical protein CCUG63696_02858 [Mycobacteroides franklinii]TDZ63303.1 hypothetical protein CCUG63695_02783 [Mycobacteroides franklinii]TDZ69700.1 hypothetical protein CCUG64056_02856 [Mycobacteroides franklinii]
MHPIIARPGHRQAFWELDFLRGRTAVLAVMAFAAGIGLGMLLCLVLTVVLFPFFWSEGIYWAFWITLGISVILAIVAAARMVRFNERLCYWHAVLAGLCSLTWFMAIDVAVEYGLQTLRR